MFPIFFFQRNKQCCYSWFVVVKTLKATAAKTTTKTTTGRPEAREGGKVHSYTIHEFAFSWKRDIKSNSHKVNSQQQQQQRIPSANSTT